MRIAGVPARSNALNFSTTVAVGGGAAPVVGVPCVVCGVVFFVGVLRVVCGEPVGGVVGAAWLVVVGVVGPLVGAEVGADVAAPVARAVVDDVALSPQAARPSPTTAASAETSIGRVNVRTPEAATLRL